MLDWMQFAGHSLVEYRMLLNLSDEDLCKPIVDVGAGLSSFNAEVTTLGGQVISLDVLYDQQGQAVKEIVTTRDQTAPHQGRLSFNAGTIEDAEEKKIIKRKYSEAAGLFMRDYGEPDADKRYQWALLPQINFQRERFDLALSSHFLFYNMQGYGEEFHLNTIENMLYVAKEARIAPLVTRNNEPSALIEPVVKGLEANGFSVTFSEGSYPFYSDKRLMVVTQK